MPYGKGSKRAGTKSGGGPRNTPLKFGAFGSMAHLFGGGKNRQPSLGALGFGFNRGGNRPPSMGLHGSIRSRRASTAASAPTPTSTPTSIPTSTPAPNPQQAVARSMFGGFRKLYRGKYEK
jgi:hypothetical protein